MRKAPFILAALLLAACSGEPAITPVVTPVEPGILTPSPDPWNLQDQMSAVNPGAPVPSTVRAGFGATRTHLEVNSGGTAAKVLWDAGDSFHMYSFDVANKRYYAANYTTTSGGASAEFTSPNTINVYSWCYSIYPGINKLGTYQDGSGDSYPVVQVNLPANQTAVAGTVENGINLSYAVSETQTGDLTFHNIPCLIRFRITGSLTSSIKNVTVKGQNQLAGDMVLKLEAGEAFTTSLRFSDSEASASATLSGDYVPGQDYFLAVYPSTQRFSMIFDDGDGHSTTKSTPNPVNLEQGKVLDFGTIDLGDAFTDATPVAPVLYRQATKGSKPVTFVIVPEGFRESESADYELLAREAVDAIFSVEPYKAYKDYFNVWIMYAWSRESGASVTDGNYNITEYHDTYFSAKWGQDSYGDMSADAVTLFEFVEKNCPDIINGIHPITEVPVLMIVNDDRYGGINWTYGNGMAYCIAPHSYGGGRMGWGFPGEIAVSDSDPSAGVRKITSEELAALGSSTGNWLNVVVHEFCGHCMSRLGDEYWYEGTTPAEAGTPISTHTYDVPFGLNVSATYDNPLWQELLDIKPALVARDPLYDRIGVYQGGWYSALNRWRSEMVSSMIDNRFYFSTWQRVLIVRRILSLAGDTFDMNDFLAKDVTVDPLRDVTSSPAPGGLRFSGPVRMVPMTPPPVFVPVD